jgi:TRAP-type mannitol/chloroaromatic compound transport system permease large subunit
MTLLGQLDGLRMLLLLGFLVIRTGLPVWALLLGVSRLLAVIGLSADLFGIRILQALPVRTIGLLENDLLQAMPLYVLMGVLLQRLTLADSLYACLLRQLRSFGGAPVLTAFGLGALLSPTNGSVAASSVLLTRLITPRLTHLKAGQSVAVMRVAATIDVVVPPSLVLLLLGDAMLSAHLEASRLPGYMQTSQTIINTRDVMHAALLPAVGVLLLWAVIACVKSRRLKPLQTNVKVSNGQSITGLITASTIVLLLAGVFTGRLYAVEAAATGAVLMLLFSFATRALNFAAWREVCMQALSLSGALFALLVGATTFSLVFRLFGTDRLLNSWLLGSTLTPIMSAAIVLVLVGLCA